MKYKRASLLIEDRGVSDFIINGEELLSRKVMQNIGVTKVKCEVILGTEFESLISHETRALRI